jgi:tetratricopeptide (TPR) repeat protein
MSGDLDEARALMKQRIELGKETGDLATISIESNNLSMVERQLGNFQEAEALARQALDISSRRGDFLSMAWNLNGLAASVAQRADFNRAAMLIGAADAAMEAANAAWPPDELIHYNETVSLLQKAMAPGAFERQRTAGRAMTTSEAVAFALGTTEPPKTSPTH